MEAVFRSSASRTLLSLCLLLILLVLLQILYIQKSLLLNSFEMARPPCAHGTNHAVLAKLRDSNTDDMVSYRYDTDYKHSNLHKQLTVEQFNNSANLSEQTEQQDHHPPKCLIIGVRKGGTRALLQTIALHPDVKVAKKEVVIEKTPAYFISPEAPERVHSLNAKMKLILIVRDPVIRLISDFTQVYYNKLELNKTQVDFKKAVLQANPSSLNYAYKPVRNSLYDVHLARWLEYFPISQVLVLDGDNFIRDPLKQLRLTEKFLNLKAKIRADQLMFNERKGFYCFRKKQKRVARCLGQTKGRVQVPVDNKFQKLLAKQFSAHNQRFFAQINASFPLWGI